MTAGSPHRPGASFCALAAHAVGERRENVGVISTHFTLVDYSRQTAGPGQDTEQRHLGEAHSGATVVGEQDLVGADGELIAAPCADASDRCDPMLPECFCASSMAASRS